MMPCPSGAVCNWSVWTPYEYVNITNYTGMITYSNTITGSYFGLSVIFMTFIISYIMTRRYPTAVAIAFSGYISFVLSIFLRILNVVADWVVILFAVFVISATIAMLVYKKSY
jgi:hypothetical protein